MPAVNLKQVEKDYGKVIGIEEWYHPKFKWTQLTPDLCRLHLKTDISIKEVPAGEIVETIRWIDIHGGILIQLKCQFNKTVTTTPTFEIAELLMK